MRISDKRLTWLLALLVVSLNAADAASTLHVVADLGLGCEANPDARAMLSLGSTAFVAWKMTASTCCAALVSLLPYGSPRWTRVMSLGIRQQATTVRDSQIWLAVISFIYLIVLANNLAVAYTHGLL